MLPSQAYHLLLTYCSLLTTHYLLWQAFTAKPDNLLVVADYGQLELRLLAHIARCESMITAFASGGCFHSRTAMGMFEHVRAAADCTLCGYIYEGGETQNHPKTPITIYTCCG